MANLKAVYSIRELANLSGLSVQQLHRRLGEAGVIKGRGRGRRIDVPLVAFRGAFPDIWESIVLAQQFAA